eukprot:TRINITY_DN74596_c0_g1_i1.p1 TRINITY_DN74596_c0_g1~~TRINITY_DN74596_c0_g1_i1.p1  ORF type:complete len:318 (+),score=42.91 TRINITY_DN74596_c0_g1_i1:255-1208(+)
MAEGITSIGGCTSGGDVAVGSMASSLIAGGAAVMLADMAVHPLSTVKTRLQVQGARRVVEGARNSSSVTAYRGILHALWNIPKQEGLVALYRGMGAVLVGGMPGHFLYLGAYEASKRHFGSDARFSNCIAASGSAHLCGSILLVPVEVVKQRLQVRGQIQGTQTFGGSFATLFWIVRNEGFFSMYRGFIVQQLSWSAYYGCYLSFYQQFKSWCLDVGYADDKDILEPTAQLLSSSAAATLAAVITNPLDVLKTRVQAAGINTVLLPQNSAWQTSLHMWKHEGFAAFFNGAVARATWLAPRLTISFAAWERLCTEWVR